MLNETSFQGLDESMPNEIEDPILVHYRAWIAARTIWYELSDLPESGDWDSPEIKAFAQAEFEARAAMLATPATTTAGFAALMHLIWNEKGPQHVPTHPEYEEEFNLAGLEAMKALWRSLTGQEQPPAKAGVDFQVCK